MRQNIAWKVAAGLAIDAPGIHPMVLTYRRKRLAASKNPERIFDAVRGVIRATGVLKRTRPPGPGLDGVGRRGRHPRHRDQARRRHPPGVAGRSRGRWCGLGSGLLDAVGLLALVAGQDVEPGDEEGTWRIAQRVAPDRVVSIVDPESRHVHKTVHDYRDGYKGPRRRAHPHRQPRKNSPARKAAPRSRNTSPNNNKAIGLRPHSGPRLMRGPDQHALFSSLLEDLGQVRDERRQQRHGADRQRDAPDDQNSAIRPRLTAPRLAEKGDANGSAGDEDRNAQR